MEEFLKIDWSIDDLSKVEQPTTFISEECLNGSYFFIGLKEPEKLNDNPESSINKKNYIPGRAFYKQGTTHSKLTKMQHYNCLNALQILQAGKDINSLNSSDQQCISLYTDLKNTIAEENDEFLKFVKNQWQFRKSIRPGPYFVISKMWEKKLVRSLMYKQYYREYSSLSLSSTEEEESIEIVHQKNAFETGTVAKFSHPTLQTQCLLNMTFSKVDTTMTFNSKLPVSQDKNIPKLLENDNFDLAISSSALKKVMDCDNCKSYWNIPVIVREEKGKKIVYIDKALPHRRPTFRQLNEKLYKILVKINLCQFEAVSFPDKEDLIPSPQLTFEKEINNIRVHNSREKLADSSLKEDEKLDDDASNSSINVNSIHHNVSYRIWSMKQNKKDIQLKNNFRELKILLRCKLDACESLENKTLQPLVITPKLEYQLGYGAEVATKSELSNLWTSLFFRPFSNSYRIRINPMNNEVAVVEPCSLQKINNEAMHFYKMKPCLGLHILYKICQVLVKLDLGAYMLHHNPKDKCFVSLLKATDEYTQGVYDLHEEYKLENCTPTPKNLWRPIDPNYILPTHMAYRRMPGMFVPSATNPKTKKKKNKKAKKAKLGSL